MGKTIKRVFLTTALFCSLFYLSLPILAYAADEVEKAPITENVEVDNKGSVAEPPSGPNTTIDAEIKTVEVQTPASVTGKKVQGTGTVTDFSTSGSKAFYTITDKDHNVFYLIVDLDKTENNVYFLSDVNKSDLEGGSVDSKENVPPVQMAAPPVTEEEPKEGGNSFLLIVLLVAAVVVVVYYFRVIKKKKEQGNTSADEDEMLEDYEDEDMFEYEDKKDNRDDK